MADRIVRSNCRRSANQPIRQPQLIARLVEMRHVFTACPTQEKPGTPAAPIPEPAPAPNPEPAPAPSPDTPSPGPSPSTRTLVLAGTVPPEVWNRLGTRILPRLRSGADLKIGVEFSVTVASESANSLARKLRRILQELGLGDAMRIQ
jgi:hypothetical protein